MSPEGKKAYRERYKGFASPSVGDLPGVSIAPDDETLQYFFWSAVSGARSEGKSLMRKVRRKLRPEEEAKLRRQLEMVAHMSRLALAYMDKM